MKAIRKKFKDKKLTDEKLVDEFATLIEENPTCLLKDDESHRYSYSTVGYLRNILIEL
jgi:hypothetical protein